MRLINSNALKKQITEVVYTSKGIREIIDNAPTVEERQQGDWLCDDLYLDCRCSICNSYALERGYYPELSQYCPACGAIMVNIKMRGVNNGT